MKNLNDVFYSLTISDIQLVSLQEIDRELTEDEIEEVKNLISKKINWYDAICDSILEKKFN